MPVLKLRPACKSYIWGGARLISEFFKDNGQTPLAETWELSCHKDGQSVIAQGDHAGRTLAEWLAEKGQNALGLNCADCGEFPILIKFIDAAQELSIQVHPDDAYARLHEGQSGKTEAWYIVDCEKSSYLYFGFTRRLTKDEFCGRIADGTLVGVMRKISVNKGDVFFVSPGTVHAIGAGLLVAEIQQSSNVTYRVYDHGRLAADGRARELHIEKACAVAQLAPARTDYDFNGHLVHCPYFTVDKLRITDKGVYFAGADTFHSLLVLEGKGKIVCGADELSYCKGDSFFIAASSGEYIISGFCEALLTTIGARKSEKRRARGIGEYYDNWDKGGIAADGLHEDIRRLD